MQRAAAGGSGTCCSKVKTGQGGGTSLWAALDSPGAVHGALALQLQRGALAAAGLRHGALEACRPLLMNTQILLYALWSLTSRTLLAVHSCCACFEATA